MLSNYELYGSEKENRRLKTFPVLIHTHKNSDVISPGFNHTQWPESFGDMHRAFSLFATEHSSELSLGKNQIHSVVFFIFTSKLFCPICFEILHG
jgi:hypothetical protein